MIKKIGLYMAVSAAIFTSASMADIEEIVTVAARAETHFRM